MTTTSPEKSQLIQAYMILHSQQTNVRRRVSVDSSSSGSPSPSSSPGSISTSPVHFSPIFTTSPSSSRQSSRSSSISTRRSSLSPATSPTRSNIPTILEEPQAPAPPTHDEMKLADLSSKIKNTLTDLLNCDAVKRDARMRSWVATRLMDVEHDLKEQKRRRHSADSMHADLIAAHLQE